MKSIVSPPSRLGNQKGGTLIVSVSAVATIAVLIAVTADLTGNTLRVTERAVALEQARAIGDASLELAYSQWRAICRTNARVPQPTSAFSDTIFGPTQEDIPELDPNGTGAFINNLSISAVDPTLVPTENQLARIEAGINESTSIYSYLASVTVTVPTRFGNVQATQRRVFRQTIESPWSYAIFFQDDLEMNAGATQVITGPVHTNSTLYATSNKITFNSRVTSATAILHDFAPGAKEWAQANNIKASVPNFNTNIPPTISGLKDPLGLNLNDFNTTDANPNNDGYRELIERPVPGHSDPLAMTDPPQRLYTNAAVKIIIEGTDANPVLRVFRGTGNNPVEVSPNSPQEADRNYYSAVAAALRLNEGFYDQRERANIGITSLDVGVLRQGIENGSISNYLSSSVIYFTDTRTSTTPGGPKKALRLRNGAILPSSGLTVASDLPIYVQGDFNTGGPNPPTNTTSSTSASPTVPGYERRPAAIVGDAVNILSNSWNDSNSASASTPLSQRRASHTTVNAGIISGHLKSTKAGVDGATANTYSGGAENFPRFLENWDSVRFTYYGSMLQLYRSKQAVGTWSYGGLVYTAPIRNWFFDTKFRTNPPPGFLVTTNFERGIWINN